MWTEFQSHIQTFQRRCLKLCSEIRKHCHCWKKAMTQCTLVFVDYVWLSALQWTRSWVSRTSTCSTVFSTMRRRTHRCLVRRRRGRVRKSCQRPSSSSLRLALTHYCAWSSGNRQYQSVILHEFTLHLHISYFDYAGELAYRNKSNTKATFLMYSTIIWNNMNKSSVVTTFKHCLALRCAISNFPAV